MTQMMDVYTFASTASSMTVDLPSDLQHAFPRLAVSSSRPADQAWFWRPEWQEGEREADEQIAAGQTTYFDSTEDFLAALDREIS
jgi:hypothetical protein